MENLLLQYARVGCLVSVGRDWTPNEMESAVVKGPHSLSLEDDAISQIQVEAREKFSQGFATIVKWDDITQNPSPILKFSPLAMIPHKSRKYKAILGLSSALTMEGWDLPSVNEATKELVQMDSSMETYEILYFQDGEQGYTQRKIYYCNMQGLDTRSRLEATRLQMKWSQK